MKRKRLNEEELKVKAKEHIQAWNVFREVMNESYTYNQIKDEANSLRLPYVNHMLSRLKKKGILISPARGYWCFSKDTPIHYSVIIECIEYQRDVDNRRRSKTVEEPIVEKVLSSIGDLSHIPDISLVEELRKRGYEVKATKTIEL